MTSVVDTPRRHADDGREPVRIARRSLHKEVTSQLRDMIVEQELSPGERIDEKRLCDLFGISRTPLREALKVLASEGLIELLPNRGARVTKISAEETAELFDVVAGLERMAAEIVAERADDRAIAPIRALHDRMAKHHDARRRSKYFSINHQIHNLIVAQAGNGELRKLHDSLMAKIRRSRYAAIMSQERWDESMREHCEIIDALEAHDAPRAGRVMLDHVRRTGTVVRQFLAQSDV